MTTGAVEQDLDDDEAAALHAIGWRPTDRRACPDPALLMAAAEDTLDDGAMAARIRSHADTCASCRVLATDMAVVLAEDPSTAESQRIAGRIKAGVSRSRWQVNLTYSGGMASTAVTMSAQPKPRESGLDTSNGLESIQRRIGLYTGTIALIGVAFLIVGTIGGIALELPATLTLRPVAQIFGIALLATVWGLCRAAAATRHGRGKSPLTL